MASLDILCSSPLNLINKITKIEHKKIFCGPSKILKNFEKYFMAHPYMPKIFHNPHKNPPTPSCILNVRSLKRIAMLIKNCAIVFARR